MAGCADIARVLIKKITIKVITSEDKTVPANAREKDLKEREPIPENAGAR